MLKTAKKFLLCITCIFGITCGITAAHAVTCGSNQIDVDGTCVNGKFAVKTTNLNANDTFTWTMSATGTFYVDCGADGVLTSNANDVTNGNTITRSGTSYATYTCTYSTGGVKTIAFDGEATGYNNSNPYSYQYAPIAFYQNTKLSSVSGDLSSMFPYLGSATGLYPWFVYTFYGCTSLTSITATLFSGYTTGVSNMFQSTFSGCTGLTSIPAGLFSGITTGVSGLFQSTFKNCTSLTSIPAGLFSGITTSAYDMFGGTFYGCTGLTSIPANLFSGITTGANYMFANTFRDCTGLTSIPAGLFSGITTSAQSMFDSTFFHCTGLTSIPADLFSGITTGADYMFASTFASCFGITSIPAGLFSGITTSADYMFASTFASCSSLTFVPATLFSGITTGASNMFDGTFKGTGLTSVPSGLFSGITTSANNMFNTTFYACANLTGYIPPTTFGGLIANNHPTASDMWWYTFTNTNVATSCASYPGTKQYTTGYESEWEGRVSCQVDSSTAGAITYVMDGGTNYSGAPDLYLYGTGATIDGKPTKAGYVFAGWCTDSTLETCAMTQTIGTDATGDKTFYAKWTQCTACAATNASCELSVVNNVCTYTTACNSGYGNIQNNGAYNASCTALPTYNITYVMDSGTNYSGAPSTYTEGTGTTIDGIPTKNGYIFAGWCTDSTLETCAMTQTIGTSATGDKTFYAKWTQCDACAATNASCELSVENNTCTYTTSCNTGYGNIQNNGAYNASCSANTYTVSYACGTGATGAAPANGTATYDASFTPAANTCTKTGYSFIGWGIDGTNNVKPAGTAFTWNYDSDKTLTAKWAKFAVTTTNLNANDTFEWTMSATGTFTVDCGTDGVLSSDANDVTNGNTITRSDTTYATYTCTYSTGGVKTISFDGTATGYNNSTSTSNSYQYAPIAFYQNTKLASISGDLSSLFPQLGSGLSNLPRFMYTFYGCTGLTSIPATLFSGITTGASYMFGGTFYGCTGLTSIPATLFSGITTGSDYMFEYTFDDCKGLTSIPATLFSNITTSANSMFHGTFAGCTGLTSIPATLFSGITTGANSMFHDTFYACTGLTSIPSGLFSGITTGAYAMFRTTFFNCTGLTSLPADLFSNITTGAGYMFMWTFFGCTNLSGYIPPTTFAGLIANGSPNAEGMWGSAFNGTKLATSCDGYPGTTQYITGYEGSSGSTDWNGKVSCGEYAVTYSCGDGTGTPPATTGAGANAPFKPAANTCEKTGATFTGWAVSDTQDVKPAGTFFTWEYTGNKTLTAQFDQCTPCDATNASCTFDGVVNNVCTYTTACNDGYYDIQNDGEYNASCTACGGDEYYCTNGTRNSVDTGYYSTGGTETTHTGQSQCTSGYYCSGGVQNECPSGYGSSAAGATAQNQCYRACTTSNIENSATVTGNDYYGDGTDTCEPTTCENGWHPKAATPDLTTIIGVTEGGTGYVSNNYTGSQYGNDGGMTSASAGISNDPMAFAVDYGNSKGVIKGHGRCSTRSATDPWVGTNSAYVLQSDGTPTTLPDSTGQYCYCMLDGYTPDGDTLQSLSSPWVFIGGYVVADNCALSCAYYCASHLRSDSSIYLAFRAVMFGSLGTPGPAMCAANIITINWTGTTQEAIDANEAGQCTYGGNIRTPQSATHVPGKTFTGWRFVAPSGG